jgi:hypothetical protein
MPVRLKAWLMTNVAVANKLESEDDWKYDTHCRSAQMPMYHHAVEIALEECCVSDVVAS